MTDPHCTTAFAAELPGTAILPDTTPDLPAWVRALFPGATTPGPAMCAGHAATVAVTRIDDAALVSVTIPGADRRDAGELRAAVAAVYTLIRAHLAEAGAPHAVRMWNFIPRIHAPMEGGLDRYRVFNLGRYDGFCRWFGDARAFPPSLPTATGVGHAGSDLAVHALGLTTPGLGVENPRQREAFRYSARYGPRPPCFARATRARLPGGERLLIGGTASVRGEDSVHAGSLAAQLDELAENLRSLLNHAQAGDDPLTRLESARVYYLRPQDAAFLREALPRLFPACVEIEFVRSDICRPELLVEVEGVARVHA